MSTNHRRTCDRPGRMRPWVCALALLLPIGWTLAAPACETTPKATTTTKKAKKKHTVSTTTTKKPTTTTTTTTTPLPEKVTDTPKVPTTTTTNTVTPTTPTPTTTTPGTILPGTVTPVPERVAPIPEPSTALIGLGIVGAVAVAMRARQRAK